MVIIVPLWVNDEPKVSLKQLGHYVQLWLTADGLQRYYERLEGIYGGAESITDYAAGEAKTFFNELSEWKVYDGFLFSLYLSAHCSLSNEVKTENLGISELLQAYEYIEQSGDILSQIGLIEVGQRIFPVFRELEEPVLRLIQKVCDDKPGSPESDFKLISTLFIFVDGELSRLRIIPGVPPLYRRLAAFAHASLIHRKLIECRAEHATLQTWAIANGSESFYMQS